MRFLLFRILIMNISAAHKQNNVFHALHFQPAKVFLHRSYGRLFGFVAHFFGRRSCTFDASNATARRPFCGEQIARTSQRKRKLLNDFQCGRHQALCTLRVLFKMWVADSTVKVTLSAGRIE